MSDSNVPTFNPQMRGMQMIATGDRTASLYVYDVIGEYNGGGITANEFRKQLEALGEIDTLDIFINSPGGSVVDGHGMIALLNRHPARKRVFIDGAAWSMASVLACCGSEIQISESATIMIHDPFDASGSEDNDSEVMQKIRDAIVRIYCQRTGQPEATIRNWMKKEQWFAATEAVAAGFADSTYPALRIAAQYDPKELGYRGLSAPVPFVRSAEEQALFDRIEEQRIWLERNKQKELCAWIAEARAELDKPESLRRAESKRRAAARMRATRTHPQRREGFHEAAHGVLDIVNGAPIHSVVVYDHERDDGDGDGPYGGVSRSWHDHLSDRENAMAAAAGAAAELYFNVGSGKMAGDDLRQFQDCIERMYGTRDIESYRARELWYDTVDFVKQHAMAIFVLAERLLGSINIPVAGVEAHRIVDENLPKET